MATSITISRIVVVESLQPQEVSTGTIHANWIGSLVVDRDVGIGVDLVKTSSSEGFRKVLRELASTARSSGDSPILHIECHGSRSAGLWFADGSVISWEALGPLFTELNIASEFNLLVLVSACYGAHLTGQFSPVRPAPAWGVVAPTFTVDPAEILSGFREFYARFAATKDLGLAAMQLSQARLSKGQWFSKLAEEWFVELVVAYVRKHCTGDAIRHWARTLCHQMKRQGMPATVRQLERELKTRNASDLTGKYFDRFFCLAEIPSNTQRFLPVRQRIQAQIEQLRINGRLAI